MLRQGFSFTVFYGFFIQESSILGLEYCKISLLSSRIILWSGQIASDPEQDELKSTDEQMNGYVLLNKSTSVLNTDTSNN